jgi:hypothetical protein
MVQAGRTSLFSRHNAFTRFGRIRPFSFSWL